MNKIIFLTTFYILGLIIGNIDYSIVLGLILIFFVLIYRKNIKNNFALLIILALAFGILNYQIRNKEEDKLSEVGFANNIVITGRILSTPEFIKEKDKIRFYFEVKDANFEDEKLENINCKTFVTINNPDNINEIKIVNIVEIKGKLRTPIASSNPYQFDYSKYLKRKGALTTFYGEKDCLQLIQEPDFSYSNLDFNNSKL